MTTITLEKAKEQFDQLIERARAGEDIVITTSDRDYVRLQLIVVEVKSSARRQRPGAGRFRGLAVSNDDLFGPLPDDELKLWTGDP